MALHHGQGKGLGHMVRAAAVAAGASFALTGTPTATAVKDAPYTSNLTITGGVGPFSLKRNPAYVQDGHSAGVLTPGIRVSISGTTVSLSGNPHNMLNTAGAVITVVDAGNGNAEISCAPFGITITPNTVDGFVIDTPLASGFFSGFTPRVGDDFLHIAYNAAPLPHGLYTGAKEYSQGPRGHYPQAIVDLAYEGFPWLTGAKDRNKGAVVADFANTVYSPAASVCRTRLGSNPNGLDTEAFFMWPQQRMLGSMITTTIAARANADASGYWFVWRSKLNLPPADSAHFADWQEDTDPSIHGRASEYDAIERNTGGGGSFSNSWDRVGHATGTRTGTNTVADQDDTYRTHALFVARSGANQCRLYRLTAGSPTTGTWTLVEQYTPTGGANQFDKLASMLFTAHLWNSQGAGAFLGQSLTGAEFTDWLADATGAYRDLDYWVLLTPNAAPHYRPKTVVPPKLVTWATSGTAVITIPEKSDLWSAVPASESWQIHQYEDVEPGFLPGFSLDAIAEWLVGTTYPSGYTSASGFVSQWVSNDVIRVFRSEAAGNVGNALPVFPATSNANWTLVDTVYMRAFEGVTVDLSAGVRSFTFDMAKIWCAGRTLIIMGADNGPGCSTESAVIPVYFAPRVATPYTLVLPAGGNFRRDMYWDHDPGILRTGIDGARKNIITYDAADLAALNLTQTGDVLQSGVGGVSGATGTRQLRFYHENSVGQTLSGDRAPTVSSTLYDYEELTSGLVALYKAEGLELLNGVPKWWHNSADSHSRLRVSTRRGNEKDFSTQAAPQGSISVSVGGLNSLDCVAMVRDTSAPARALATQGDIISQLVQGFRKPFSIAMAYQRQDTAAGYTFGWSMGGGISDSANQELMGVEIRNGGGGTSSRLNRNNTGTSANSPTLSGAWLITNGEIGTFLWRFDGQNSWLDIKTPAGAFTRLSNVAFPSAIDTLTKRVCFGIGAMYGANATTPTYSNTGPSMKIGEIRVWDYKLTDAERTTVMSTSSGVGMSHKWGA